MPDQPNYERFLSGWELLKFYARMHGLSPKYAHMRMEAVLNLVDLQAVKHRKLGYYSKGMLQRLGLAQAMIHEPELLLLDEPISGMDPIAHEAMLKILCGLREAGKTIIISSHRLDLMPRFCDRLALLYRGRLLAEDFANRWIAQTDDQLTIAGLDTDQRAQVSQLVASLEGACLVDANEALPSLEDWFLQNRERSRAIVGCVIFCMRALCLASFRSCQRVYWLSVHSMLEVIRQKFFGSSCG